MEVGCCGHSPGWSPDSLLGGARAEARVATGGVAAPQRIDKSLLVGNPNVGKSALFFALTGRYVTVSNYPGTTIEVTRGMCPLPNGSSLPMVDTPGTTRLSASSDDERATCDLLRSMDPSSTGVVVVIDARNLRRGLALVLEVGALGFRTALAVNMMDEARALGLAIDTDRLQRLLGVPVVPTVATTGEGVEALRAQLTEVRMAAPPPDLQWAPGHDETDAERRLAIADALRAEVVGTPARDAGGPGWRPRLAAAFGRAATHRVWGWPILFAVLYLSYLIVGDFAAGTAVDFLENTVFGAADGNGLNGLLAGAFARLHPPVFLYDLLFGDYGVFTMAVTYALALILPIVTSFFIVFGILEDTGYLPRLAVVTNRAFSAIGLNGKAVLPMVLGLGCDTMATMATRILSTRRERLLVSFLLALAVPCSAQLAVIFGLYAVVAAPGLLFVWIGVVVAVLLAVGWLAGKLLPGETSDFIIELPPIRTPRVGNIVRKTLARVEWYLKEAVPLFVLGTIILFALDRVGALPWIVRGAEPLVTGLLDLPKEMAAAFVVGFLRRDYGAVYLFDAARDGLLTPGQVLVSTVTITLFIPCVASYFMLVREFGTKTALAVAGLVFVLAFGVGGLVNVVVGLV